jgi:hypothetical protein
VTPEITERLNSRDIGVMSEGQNFLFLVRNGCLAVVSRTPWGALESISGVGISTDHGLAYLVWREERAMLVAHEWEGAAEAEQVQLMQRFAADLKEVLGLP